jgi:V/A-type H+/Na+-transporting ATPase subunit E
MALWGEIELLCRAIATEGQTEAEKILAQAQAAAQRLLAAAQERAEAKFQEEILSRRSKAYAEAKRQVDAADLEAKRRVMAFREEIMREVLQTLEDRLHNFRNDPSYPGFLLKALKEGIAHLPGQDFVVELNEADLPVFQANIRDVAAERSVNLVIKTSNEISAGVRIYTADQRQLYDNTLAARLNRLESEIKQVIWRHIFGG